MLSGFYQSFWLCMINYNIQFINEFDKTMNCGEGSMSHDGHVSVLYVHDPIWMLILLLDHLYIVSHMSVCSAVWVTQNVATCGIKEGWNWVARINQCCLCDSLVIYY